MPNPIIAVQNITTVIDENVILKDLSLTVMPQEILALVGGSGAGKSTLLNVMLMLLPITTGSITILDENIEHLKGKELEKFRTHLSVMFQGGALFSELTVLENVLFAMRQHSQLSLIEMRSLALLKILMAGLPQSAANKYPAELSGGMIKRAAVARALALDPAILFLDEPSAGLDPITANALDQLILNLRASLGLTIVVVTHDLDTLVTVPDRIVFLGDGKVLACDTLANLIQSPIPEVKAYFTSTRAARTFGESD